MRRVSRICVMRTSFFCHHAFDWISRKLFWVGRYGDETVGSGCNRRTAVGDQERTT